MNVNILGTEYTINERTAVEDDYLINCDGYCDKTTKQIVIKAENGDLGDFDIYKKKVYRHEIIHAFLYESGLSENFEHKTWGHEETMIDWIAYQFPKMIKAFEQVGCL